MPVVNANDVFNLYCRSPEEVNDNDNLAARTAILLRARKLYLLTDAEGVIKDGQLLADVGAFDNLSFLATNVGNELGCGGIRKKVEIAQHAARAGIDTIIGNVAHSRILLNRGFGTKISASQSENFAASLRTSV